MECNCITAMSRHRCRNAFGLDGCELTENLYTPDCIRTFSGRYVNVFEPTADMICIEDIAHALGNLCRFGGHLPNFYSVAQHSVLCATSTKPEHAFAALMHDASEAYLLDIPTPIKRKLTDYKGIENKMMELIAEKFAFEWPLHKEVKKIDEMMLHFEWHQLMLEKNIKEDFYAWKPHIAKERFLETFNQLKPSV